MATAAILTENNASEKDFYEKIINIPHYTSNRLFELLDQEDSREIIDENIEKYREIFEPVIKRNKQDKYFSLDRDGKFLKDNSGSSRKALMQ